MEFGEANGSTALNTQATWNNTAFAVEWAAIGINVNQFVEGGDDLTWLAQSHIAGSASNKAVASGFTPPESPE
jgi:hypothetical protein